MYVFNKKKSKPWSLGALLAPARTMATVLDAEKAAWNGVPEAPMNNPDDVGRALRFILAARTNKRDDDWALTVLRNRNYQNLNVLKVAFDNAGGFKGTNTTWLDQQAANISQATAEHAAFMAAQRTPTSEVERQRIGPDGSVKAPPSDGAAGTKSGGSSMFIILGAAGLAAILLLKR